MTKLLSIKRHIHCTEISLPLVQIIKSYTQMSIWLWKVHISLDWYRHRPKGAKLISVDWGPD